MDKFDLSKSVNHHSSAVRDLLKDWLKDNPYTVKSVAQKLGFHRMTVFNFLAGRKDLSPLLLKRIELFIYSNKDLYKVESALHQQRLEKVRNCIAEILRNDYSKSLKSLAEEVDLSPTLLVSLTHHKRASEKTLEILEKYLGN